jgi:dolichol-phosphate mannosyltransferase
VTPVISVISPFYNEASIIEAAITQMLVNLCNLPDAWEFIVVDDGSTDGSEEIARRLATQEPSLRVIGYSENRGRGYAIRTGIGAARGDIVVTTEIDCSWGNDIVQRIVAVFYDNPATDMVIASPNLPGGGYKNVPPYRVRISHLGNLVLRAALTRRITMYTGMTRGYRRKRFLELPLDQDEKEFHLEVARKAIAFDFRIREIPATLTWQHHKLTKPGSMQRASSSRIRKLMQTHLLFSSLAAPIRYIALISALLVVPATAFVATAVYNLATGEPAAFFLLTGLLLYLFVMFVLLIGLITQQNIVTQQELWRIRSELRLLQNPTDNERHS